MTRQEIYKALAEGKQLQSLGAGDVWFDKTEHEICSYLGANQNVFGWIRIKPTAKRVPLGPGDVDPHRDYVRAAKLGAYHDPRERTVIVGVTTNGIYTGKSGGHLIDWNPLFEHWEISHDGGKTWGPCWKEVADE